MRDAIGWVVVARGLCTAKGSFCEKTLESTLHLVSSPQSQTLTSVADALLFVWLYAWALSRCLLRT